MVKRCLIDFCRQLAFHLSRTFENNRTNKFDHFWCDGIKEPEKWRQDTDEFTKTKEITTTGWLGSNGQDEYWIIIRLGPASFKKCLKGLSLNDCLPGDESLDWIELDMQNREIVLQLL